MNKEAYISTLKNPKSWFDQAFSQKMVADKILNEIIMNREFIVKLKETQDYDEFVEESEESRGQELSYTHYTPINTIYSLRNRYLSVA